MSAELVPYRQQLTLIEQGVRALARANTVEETKAIRDQAQAIHHYMKQRDASAEALNHAGELKIRAERQLGALLQLRIRHQGGRPTKRSHDESVLPEGIDRNSSSRWQQIALIDERLFEAHIAQMKEEGELTTASVLRLAKYLQQPGRRPDPPREDGCEVEDLNRCVDDGEEFGTIYADPPWQYGNQATRASTDKHYKTMSLDDIAALPVQDLAAPNAHLHLWTTNAFLFECPRIMEAWGFTYKSAFIWVKPQMGIGNYWRVSHEFLLLGVRGSMPFRDKSLKSWAEMARGRHSAKPEQVRLMIEKASPPARLELFGRMVFPGWAVWGNDVSRDLFNRDVKER